MATARSWYATMHGHYTTGTWQGEIAQVGIRGTAVDSGGYFPPVVNAPLGDFQVVPDGDIEQTTDFNIQWGWRGTTNMTKDHQKTIASACRTWMDGVKSLQINSGFAWHEVRVAALDANHDYINGASIFSLRTPINGTGGQTQLPQSCVVASLRTGGRTARSRGRLYVPASGAGLAVGGLNSTATMGAVGNSTTALLRALDGVDPDIYPGVVSLKFSTWSTVTVVKVGDEVDTQRRRRNARDEVYTDYQV